MLSISSELSKAFMILLSIKGTLLILRFFIALFASSLAVAKCSKADSILPALKSHFCSLIQSKNIDTVCCFQLPQDISLL